MRYPVVDWEEMSARVNIRKFLSLNFNPVRWMLNQSAMISMQANRPGSQEYPQFRKRNPRLSSKLWGMENM